MLLNNWYQNLKTRLSLINGPSRRLITNNGKILKSNSIWYNANEFRLESVEVGDKIDVRDTEFIWCVGLIRIKIESATKEPLLVVHYEGWNKYFDEILS